MTATSFEWDPLHPIFLVLASRACRSQRQDHSHDCQCLRSGTHRLAGSFNFAMTPMTRKLTLAFVVFPLAPLNHHSTFKQLPYPFQFGSFCLFSRQALRKETSTQSPEADLTDHQGFDLAARLLEGLACDGSAFMLVIIIIFLRHVLPEVKNALSAERDNPRKHLTQTQTRRRQEVRHKFLK